MMSRRAFITGSVACWSLYGSASRKANAYDDYAKSRAKGLNFEALGPSSKLLRAFPSTMPSPELAIVLVMAGDNNLSSLIPKDLEEISSGVPPAVAILVFADFADGPAKIYEVTSNRGIQVMEIMEETDTGDPETVADFIGRSLLTYPSARKVIGFWNHGTGIFDEGDPDELIIKIALLHDNTGGVLTNLELGAVLKASFVRAGQTAPVDAIFFDADLNAMIEVYEEVRPYADFVIAPPDTEPVDGWDYRQLLSTMGKTFPPTGEVFARQAVNSFCESYKSNVADYPAVLSGYKSCGIIVDAFADLVRLGNKPGNEDQFELLGKARAVSQNYANRPSYDLLDFCKQLETLSSSGERTELVASARRLADACEKSQVSNCALGDTVKQAKGFAFWFPTTRKEFEQDEKTYRKLAFNRATNWADYLDRNLRV